MSFEIDPKSDRYMRITDSQSFEMDRRHVIALIDNLKPMYQGIRVFNKTKTAKVVISFDGAGTVIVEVTNEKEDSKFQFTVEENPKPEHQP